MSDNNNLPPSSDALQRTLGEILASESVLEGRNGRQLQTTVEEVVGDLLHDSQLKAKLLGETKVGFGMALGKFLAWKVWTEIEKSDHRKAAARSDRTNLVLKVPEELIPEVKARWPGIRSEFQERVGFSIAEPTLEPSLGDWALELRGGLLEQCYLSHDWFQPLVNFLVGQAPQLLTLSMVKQMVDKVKAEEPVVGEELERLRMPITTVYRILESLLEEGVPIREMEVILTALVLNWEQGPDRVQLVSAARKALSPWMCRTLQSSPGTLRALKLGRRIEDMFADSGRWMGSEQVFLLDPAQKGLILALIKSAYTRVAPGGPVVLLAASRLRREIWSLIRTDLPDLVVLSECEIHRGFRIDLVGVVDITEPGSGDDFPPLLEDGESLFD